MASLVFRSGPLSGTTRPLAGGALTVGRLAGCDLQVLDERVSREHCRVWFDPVERAYMIADLGSANGTRVNGERLRAERVLFGGEEIALGSTTATFIRHAPVWDPADDAGLLRTRVRGQEIEATRG